jgi:hypothetical protein
VQPLLASNWSRNQIDPKPEIKTRRWRRQQNPCPYDQHREAPVLGRQSVTGFGQRPTGELEHSDVLDSFFLFALITGQTLALPAIRYLLGKSFNSTGHNALQTLRGSNLLFIEPALYRTRSLSNLSFAGAALTQGTSLGNASVRLLNADRLVLPAAIILKLLWHDLCDGFWQSC